MFRSILSQVRKPLELSLTSGFCTQPPIRRRLREINDVKIVGTLISDSFTLQSGTKALTIRTRDSSVRHSNHNVHLNTEGNFAAGQRVYVSGKLRSAPTRTSDGKMVTASVVKASQLYVLENDSGSTSSTAGDQNQVELLANIASEVLIKEEYCTFAVATHFKKFNSEEAGAGAETDGTSFHRVFIYEPALCEYIQNNLKKSDRVLLNGKIGHMTSTGPDGKKVYSGFIVADNIYRIARRTITQSESNESTEIKAEN